MDVSRTAVAAPASSSSGAGVLQAVRSTVVAHWQVWPVVAVALGLALVYLQAAPIFALPFDDSYISLHFARNLADHGFLTFDGETASAGATSVLHVALLALPIKAGVDPVRASVALGITLHLGLVVAVYALAWSIFRDRLVSTVAAASTAVMGYLVLDALNGMETTLFLLVATLAAAALFSAKGERGLLLAGVLGALAVLSRPEGVLLVAAMALYLAVDPDRDAPLVSPATLRRLALLGAPSAIVLVALAAFYGATTGSVTPGAGTAKLFFFREFEMSLQMQFDAAQGSLANFAGPVLPWLALSAFAVRRRELLLFAFFWVAFIVLYFALFPAGLTHYWYRYQHVVLPPVAVFGSAGLVALARGLRPRALDVVAAVAIGAVLVAYVGFQYNAFRNHYADDVIATDARQLDAARYLRDETPPGSTVAAHDIGGLAFLSEREVIDLVGLVNPDALDFHDGRRLREYIDEVQPDYVLVFLSWEDRFLHLGLRDEPELFEPVQLFGVHGEPFVLYRTHYSAGAR